MKRWFLALVLAVAAGCLAVPPSARAADGGAHSRFDPDASAPESLFAWNDPVPWRAGVVATRTKRPVRMQKSVWDFEVDSLEAEIAVAPWGWLELYGRAGGFRPKMELDGHSWGKTDVGAGGALGLNANLWEIAPERGTAAWRLSIGLRAEYAWRTGKELEGAKAQWGEAFFFLPVNYHLAYHGTQRSTYATEAHALDLYLGPACSLVDGDWTPKRGTGKIGFREDQAAGIAGGIRIWLLENLGVGGEVAWFDALTLQGGLEYRF